MRSPSTLCWAALALVSAVSSNAFELPPYRPKSLDCQALKYPAQDRVVAENPEWTKEYDLTGIPDIAPNVYDETKDICAQHKKSSMNAECGDRRDEPTKCQNKKQWAFTYDDGPTQFTARVRESLKQAGDIKAIFFVVGSRLCDDDDGQMIASLNAGHEIGVHTWSHPRLSALTNGQIIAEIKWTEMAIMELTGIKPKYMRPPYGNMDDRVRFIIKKMGYTPILWTADTNDWAYNFADENDPQEVEDGLKYIKGNITKYIKSTGGKNPGTISLEHDIASIPTTAASHVIELVKKGGWTDLVPMTTCLGDNSFAQNGIIVAGGKTAKVPAKKEPAAEVPAKKEPAAAATPTKSQKPPANAQAATQESSGTSFSGSLRQTMAMAAAGAMAFFALSM